MSSVAAGLIVYGSVGAFIALILWVRLRAKPRDRRTLRVLCDELGGRVTIERASDGGMVVTVPFRGHSFEARTEYTRMGYSFISGSTVSCAVPPSSLPSFRVKASGSVGSLGALDKHPRFKHLRLETEGRDVRDAVRDLWPESAKETMRRLVNPRALREGWIPALDGCVECDGELLSFSRTAAFRRPESYLLAIEMLSDLIEAGNAAA